MEPFIGQIQPFPYNFAPRDWAFCSGQLLSIAQNTALFSLLGTTYGGNGQTTFALPNLQGRSIVHPGQGPGLSSIQWGEVGGTENTTLLSTNLPVHNHTVGVGVHAKGGEEANPKDNKIANSPNSFSEDTTPSATLGGVSVGVSGANQPFSIREPYLALNYCIAMFGIYPSRN